MRGLALAGNKRDLGRKVVMQIHDRIKTLREAQKISMRQLAKELGVSHNTISKWERNPDSCRSETALPTRDNVLSLAKHFKVTPGWLMFGEVKYKASRQKIMREIEELTDSQFRLIAKQLHQILEGEKTSKRKEQ